MWIYKIIFPCNSSQIFVSKAYYITLIIETVPLEELGVKCLTSIQLVDSMTD